MSQIIAPKRPRYYSRKRLEASGYRFLATVQEEFPSLTMVQRMAYGLDWKHSDLHVVKTGENEWSFFANPGAKKGHESEGILP